MWIFLNDAALSVVQHRDKPDVLLVRSRVAGDIERAIPEAVVWEDSTADYRYRSEVAKAVFGQCIAAAIEGIDYDNFKNSVDDRKRHDAYMGIWSVMANTYGAYGRQP